jgi:hypothetical protein
VQASAFDASGGSGGWAAYEGDWRHFFDCMFAPVARQAGAALDRLDLQAAAGAAPARTAAAVVSSAAAGLGGCDASRRLLRAVRRKRLLAHQQPLRLVMCRLQLCQGMLFAACKHVAGSPGLVLGFLHNPSDPMPLTPPQYLSSAQCLQCPPAVQAAAVLSQQGRFYGWWHCACGVCAASASRAPGRPWRADARARVVSSARPSCQSGCASTAAGVPQLAFAAGSGCSWRDRVGAVRQRIRQHCRLGSGMQAWCACKHSCISNCFEP